jgi:hypothetical protein
MNITRPTFTLATSPSGRKFTWNMTADSWVNEYQWTGTFDSGDEATAHYTEFATTYDSEATRIETSGKHEDMLGMLKDQGMLRGKKKLTDAFAKFRVS